MSPCYPYVTQLLNSLWPDFEIREIFEESGAGEWTRTIDLLITNQLLYQLSYTGLGRNTNRSIGLRASCRTRTLSGGKNPVGYRVKSHAMRG